MAGREGWKTAPAGGTEKPERRPGSRGRERGEEHTRTHSHRSQRDRKASDRSGHYGWEACWELGRLAADPQDAEAAAWDRKLDSGYALLRVWGREQTRCPPPLFTQSSVRGDILPPSHTGASESSRHRVEGGAAERCDRAVLRTHRARLWIDNVYVTFSRISVSYIWLKTSLFVYFYPPKCP